MFKFKLGGGNKGHYDIAGDAGDRRVFLKQYNKAPESNEYKDSGSGSDASDRENNEKNNATIEHKSKVPKIFNTLKKFGRSKGRKASKDIFESAKSGASKKSSENNNLNNALKEEIKPVGQRGTDIVDTTVVKKDVSNKSEHSAKLHPPNTVPSTTHIEPFKHSTPDAIKNTNVPPPADDDPDYATVESPSATFTPHLPKSSGAGDNRISDVSDPDYASVATPAWSAPTVHLPKSSPCQLHLTGNDNAASGKDDEDEYATVGKIESGRVQLKYDNDDDDYASIRNSYQIEVQDVNTGSYETCSDNEDENYARIRDVRKNKNVTEIKAIDTHDKYLLQGARPKVYPKQEERLPELDNVNGSPSFELMDPPKESNNDMYISREQVRQKKLSQESLENIGLASQIEGTASDISVNGAGKFEENDMTEQYDKTTCQSNTNEVDESGTDPEIKVSKLTLKNVDVPQELEDIYESIRPAVPAKKCHSTITVKTQNSSVEENGTTVLEDVQKQSAIQSDNNTITVEIPNEEIPYNEDIAGAAVEDEPIHVTIEQLRRSAEYRKLQQSLEGGHNMQSGDDLSQHPRKSRSLPPTPTISPKTSTSNQDYKVSKDTIIEDLRSLKDIGWYWGPLSWDDAEIILTGKQDGSFLVRDSSDDCHILSLSFRYGNSTHHSRLDYCNGSFGFSSQPSSFNGCRFITDFITMVMENSQSGRFFYLTQPLGPGIAPVPLCTLHPVSRFVYMRSLQHMCRFLILKHVRHDHIENLPLPNRTKAYLREPQYYAEYLEHEEQAPKPDADS